MWHALRCELAYSRPWILGALAIAAGVVAIVSAVFAFVGDGPPGHVVAWLRAFFPIIAGMVVGFIVQGYRAEEHRSRLLLAGPFTPHQLAAVTVLLPVLLFGVGLVVAGSVVAVEALVSGRLEDVTLRLITLFAGIFFVTVLLGPLAQESSAAHREGRSRAAVVGWALFVLAIMVLVAFQWIPFSALTAAVPVATGVVVMATTWALLAGRTDFTR